MKEDQPEVWRPIPFAPGYEVSDVGRVRCWLAPRTGATLTTPRDIRGADYFGYRNMFIHVRGVTSRVFGVHRLVLFAFRGDPPAGKPFACHRDGNPANNRLENLYWGSPADNAADAVRHGRYPHRQRSLVGGES